MRIGVLGTGTVGRTLATKLIELGHDVTLGSRSAENPDARTWAREAGPRAASGTFAHAAEATELLFNCTAGSGSLDALRAAGEAGLSGKTLIDVANPLDFSHGMPPSLFVSGTDSLAEQIQREFPELRVVKALNTMSAHVMVDPSRLGGDHDVFVCGNDEKAKGQVRELLESFGWPTASIVDLGDITAARGTEGHLLLWLRLWTAFGTGDLNIKVIRAPEAQTRGA